MRKTLTFVAAATLAAFLFNHSVLGAKAKPKAVKLQSPKILNFNPSSIMSPVIVQDVDPRMHQGTVIVLVDGKIIGVGGKKSGGTPNAPITKVKLDRVPKKGAHVLSVLDGIGRSVSYRTQ